MVWLESLEEGKEHSLKPIPNGIDQQKWTGIGRILAAIMLKLIHGPSVVYYLKWPMEFRFFKEEIHFWNAIIVDLWHWISSFPLGVKYLTVESLWIYCMVYYTQILLSV